MGKRLIIKDADFSVNGIGKSTTVWYTDWASKGYVALANLQIALNNPVTLKWSGYGVVNNPSILNVPINKIRTFFKNDSSEKFGIKTDFEYQIYKITGTLNSADNTLEVIGKFKLTSEDLSAGIKIVNLDKTVTLTADKLMGISIGLPYGTYTNEHQPCYRYDNSSGEVIYVDAQDNVLKKFNTIPGIDFGYES